MKKRLHKTSDRMIFGVCGALAEYFNLDPTIVRIAFVVAALLFGSGILLYLILAIVIPNE
ncbi:MAG: PspC domain-containing protein [Bacteroidales bacterium]